MAKAEAAKAAEGARPFLQAAAEAEGAQTLASGLVFRELVAGTGEKPTTDDTVKVQYTGTLFDGTVFDSSFSRGEPTRDAPREPTQREGLGGHRRCGEARAREW